MREKRLILLNARTVNGNPTAKEKNKAEREEKRERGGGARQSREATRARHRKQGTSVLLENTHSTQCHCKHF